MTNRTAREPDRLSAADLPGLRHLPADAGTREEFLAERARWEAEEAAQYREGEASDAAFLADLGVPWENRQPVWERVPEDIREAVRDYCDNIRAHVRAGEGLYIGAGRGAGKTSTFALVLLAAHAAGIRCDYRLAGFRLVRDLAEKQAPAQGGLLVLDDLDWVSTERSYGTGGEAESWQRIGEFCYEWLAEAGALCIAANSDYEAVTARAGMERVADRWEQRIPAWLRLGSAAGSQRKGE